MENSLSTVCERVKTTVTGTNLVGIYLLLGHHTCMFAFQSFVVRGSSQVNTMAVSVRLPPDTGPYIEHYLIQSHQGLLSLESSKFKFDSIPALIAHYSQCW